MLRLVGLGRTRNAYAPELIELFLVAAVASVLAIRVFLALTGWPQIGGAGLHIAHMLWGGLFMLLAMLLLFTMLGRAAQRFAAILGGVGFGTFIDELGKFITSDNDYHYQPTIGLIYIVFIAIFLALRAVRSRADLDPDTALANSLTLLGPVSGNQLDAGTKQETLQLLAKADTANPLVLALAAYVAGVETGEASNPGFYFRIRDRLSREYSQVVLHRRFQPALLAVFTIFALAQIGDSSFDDSSRHHLRRQRIAAFLHCYRTAGILISCGGDNSLGHLAAPSLPPRRLPLVYPRHSGEHLCHAGVCLFGVGVCDAGRAGHQHSDLYCLTLHD